MNLQEILNFYGKTKEPFFFLISYDLQKYDVVPLKDLNKDIKFSIDEKLKYKKTQYDIKKTPISIEEYKTKFNLVQDNLKCGNTYLLNLTTKTQIKTTKTLNEIYENANAKFKCKYKDEFVCFSPERFIKIYKDKIYTYPMKGTIDANIENAKSKILADAKEIAEHTMAVDLLRNDLSIVAKKVRVDRFRYCKTISAGNKKLLQVSSKISGDMPINWRENIGDILCQILPAGSISGTPKIQTMKIIKQIENYERGYYTGVFGVFDGECLDSAVAIRFIEKQEDKYIYKSGGGITSDSDMCAEYQEMIDKIYVP